MTQSDAPDEGREEKTVKALFGLEAQGHIETIERILNEHNWSNDWIWSLIGKEIGWAPSTACAFYVTHLRDQLSKEREKHDAEIKRIQASCNQAIKDVKMDYDAYAAEREMRKELVENLQQYLCLFDEGGQIHQEIESLIAKASELDKNENTHSSRGNLYVDPISEGEDKANLKT